MGRGANDSKSWSTSMIKHRHILAGATVLAALVSSTVPAQAGLIGGAGSLGGGLTGGVGPSGGSFNGALNGQSTLRTPSARPAVDKTQDTAADTKDAAQT